MNKYRINLMEEKNLYIEVLSLSKKVVLNYRLRIDFNDLVNDAYLQVLQEGKQLNFENLKEVLFKVSNCYRNENNLRNEIDIKHTQSKFCKKCNEDKPIAAFGITIRRRTNKKIIQNYCASCLARIRRIHLLKNLIIIEDTNESKFNPITTLDYNSFQNKKQLVEKYLKEKAA